MKNVENKEGFIKLNKIKKKSTKIYKKDPQNRSFGNGRFIWAKKCKPSYEDKTDRYITIFFLLLNLNLLFFFFC